MGTTHVPAEFSNRKEAFALAFRDFINAHARGMKSLEERDFDALHEAITDEYVAVERASAAINHVLRLPNPHAAGALQDGSDTDRSLSAEHARLFDQMQALEHEHRDLEKGGGDIAAHREHRTKLHAHIAELRAHLEQLRAHARERPASEE